VDHDSKISDRFTTAALFLIADSIMYINSFNTVSAVSWIFLNPVVFSILGLGYVIYYRYFHPLAKYPGPFLACLTNFWKAYQYWSLGFHHYMLDLHEKYGPIVRIGPNDLSFNGAEAIAPIYKSGRQMPKSVFYDAFTTFKPNVFGTRDEAVIHISPNFNKFIY
jgi:hypothetical protein